MVRKSDMRCGAKTRLGGKCNARPARTGGRCKWHGGCSTGPRTSEGKAKVALNLPRTAPCSRARNPK
ncbi:HGGxSTG domain-containing protein [Noviluteimonas dokdonensis]|uniref:HGGxSTG domain-containing protein n=1 Tax=Noviluteimonas dokdonensis TaxID=414050 RepID=UPI003CE51A8C